MRENCTSGTVRGVPGNRHSYRRDLTVLPMEVRTPEEFDDQFATILRLGADAILTSGDPFTSAHHRRILNFAATHRLPTVCGAVQFAEAGCLIAYSASNVALYRRAASYVDKV